MSDFIFMLTRDDVTIPDARDVVRKVLATDTPHVGFKDVGLSRPEMHALVETIQEAGRKVHLEVVSLTEEAELKSARIAVELGVDYLIGGTRWRQVGDIIAGKDIRYFPYVGQIIGHPAHLNGTAVEMLREAEAMGDAVDGINLLAYRHESLDGIELLKDVVAGTWLPVISAGSISTLDRVSAVNAAGAWGFTVGTAALDGAFASDPDLEVQINAILETACETTRG